MNLIQPLNIQAFPLLTLFASKVSAGFPSPADDYKESNLDLNEHLIKNPASTFLVRASGDSMINAGIFPNDILIVDRSLTARSGKIIIAYLSGEFTVKRLLKNRTKVFLRPENPNYHAIDVTHHQDFQIWGVVTKVIHDL